MINANINEHNIKLNEAYRCYKPEIVKNVFPYEYMQANNIILSLAKICDINLDSCKSYDYHKILSIYSSIWVRMANPNYTREKVIFNLKVKYPEYIKTDKAAEDVADFCLKCLKEPGYTLVGYEAEFSTAVEKDRKVYNKIIGCTLAVIIVLLILVIIGIGRHTVKLYNKFDHIDKEFHQLVSKYSELKVLKDELVIEQDNLQAQIDETAKEIKKIRNLEKAGTYKNNSKTQLHIRMNQKHSERKRQSKETEQEQNVEDEITNEDNNTSSSSNNNKEIYKNIILGLEVLSPVAICFILICIIGKLRAKSTGKKTNTIRITGVIAIVNLIIVIVMMSNDAVRLDETIIDRKSNIEKYESKKSRLKKDIDILNESIITLENQLEKNESELKWMKE